MVHKLWKQSRVPGVTLNCNRWQSCNLGKLAYPLVINVPLVYAPWSPPLGTPLRTTHLEALCVDCWWLGNFVTPIPARAHFGKSQVKASNYKLRKYHSLMQFFICFSADILPALGDQDPLASIIGSRSLLNVTSRLQSLSPTIGHREQEDYPVSLTAQLRMEFWLMVKNSACITVGTIANATRCSAIEGWKQQRENLGMPYVNLSFMLLCIATKALSKKLL